MNLKKMNKEELENMSYDDLAYELLLEVVDFFEILTLDKRFIMLEDGSWDLKDRHIQNVIIDEEDEDLNIEDIDETEEKEDEENIFYDEDNDDDSEDDLKDLVVIDEKEEEESSF